MKIDINKILKEQEKGDVKSFHVPEIPPIHISFGKDGELDLEWIFPETRVGFTFGCDESGWYVVSKKITAAGPIELKI